MANEHRNRVRIPPDSRMHARDHAAATGREMELIARARRASETNRCGYSDTKYERSYNDFMGKALQEKYKKEIEAIVAAKEAERRI